jgi:hypothetical protein
MPQVSRLQSLPRADASVVFNLMMCKWTAMVLRGTEYQAPISAPAILPGQDVIRLAWD